METPQAIQIGNRTVNLLHVTWMKCVDVDIRRREDADIPEKALILYFTSGRSTRLFKGDPEVCNELYKNLNTTLGVLNLTDIARV